MTRWLVLLIAVSAAADAGEARKRALQYDVSREPNPRDPRD